jgi:hypothetical protein
MGKTIRGETGVTGSPNGWRLSRRELLTRGLGALEYSRVVDRPRPRRRAPPGVAAAAAVPVGVEPGAR